MPIFVVFVVVVVGDKTRRLEGVKKLQDSQELPRFQSFSSYDLK